VTQPLQVWEASRISIYING